jgi:hypothetical protein
MWFSIPIRKCRRTNRQADNWRPLIAIADAFGPHWGEAARDAAVTFQKGYNDEDAGVTLLSDIRDIFNARRVDRLASATIVAALNDLADGPWCEWRGVRDDPEPASALTRRAGSTVDVVRHSAALDLAASARRWQQEREGLPPVAVRSCLALVL